MNMKYSRNSLTENVLKHSQHPVKYDSCPIGLYS